MEWIKTIFPLLGVLVGWLLAESGKIFTDKRQDKRKLKKLLFLLLELRYYFAKELSYEIRIDKFLNITKSKLSEKFGLDIDDPQLNLGIESFKPHLLNVIAKAKTDDNKFDYFSENIDKIILELAEIFPLLAYELNGQHNIKEQLTKANTLFNEFENFSSEVSFDFKKVINPKLTEDLLSELDQSIEKVAAKIDKRTASNSKEKILKMNFDNSDPDLDKRIDEFLKIATEHVQSALD